MKLIIFSPIGAKALDRIAEPMRTGLIEAVTAYALGKPGDTKAMSGTPTVRMRVGDYRIIFDESEGRILILAIGHRREIYR